MNGKTTYFQRNREIRLSWAKTYDENNKERLREEAKNRFRKLSNEERKIKREYGRSKYHNMSEENKQRLKEYQKNYRKAKKMKIKMFYPFFFTRYENGKKNLKFWWKLY